MAFEPLLMPNNAAIWHGVEKPSAGPDKEPHHNMLVGFDSDTHAVEFRFSFRLRGAVKRTEIILSIGRDDFHLLFDAMLKAS